MGARHCLSIGRFPPGCKCLSYDRRPLLPPGRPPGVCCTCRGQSRGAVRAGNAERLRTVALASVPASLGGWEQSRSVPGGCIPSGKMQRLFGAARARKKAAALLFMVNSRERRNNRQNGIIHKAKRARRRGGSVFRPRGAARSGAGVLNWQRRRSRDGGSGAADTPFPRPLQPGAGLLRSIQAPGSGRKKKPGINLKLFQAG